MNGKKIIIMRRSCLTGKVVWLYTGPTRGAGRIAYYRACRAELRYAQRFSDAADRRRANIMRLLNECLAELPITETLTREQTEAARRLRALAEEQPAYQRDFLEHVVEERKRRKEDKEIRRKSRERQNVK